MHLTRKNIVEIVYKRMFNGEILLRDTDEVIYLNYLNTVKQGMNQMESEWGYRKML